MNAPIVAGVAFGILILTSGDQAGEMANLAASLVFASLLPLASIYYLWKRRVISDFYAMKRETRWMPFLAAIMSYLGGGVMLTALKAPAMVTALMLCYLVNTAVMMLISTRWKISIHESGITGPSTVLIYALGLPGWLLMLCAIPVGWARVTLKAHSVGQVLAGALLTIALTFVEVPVFVSLL